MMFKKFEPTKLNVIEGNIVKDIKDYRFMAFLSRTDVNLFKDSVWGGATFISQNLLLTAAHNFLFVDTQNLQVAYGGLNLENDYFDTFKIKKVHFIPSFKISPNDKGAGLYIENDLAIIEIEPHPNIIFETIDYNPTAPSYLTSINQIVRTIGWGSIWPPAEIPKELRYGDSIIVPVDEIKTYLKNNYSELEVKVYKPEQFIGVRALDGKTAAVGDSGGPLLSYNEDIKKYVQIGIASWVPPIKDTKISPYVFYTNLLNTDYQNWIQSIVEKTRH